MFISHQRLVACGLLVATAVEARGDPLPPPLPPPPAPTSTPSKIVFDGSLGFGFGNVSATTGDAGGSMGIGADIGRRVSDNVALGGQMGVDVFTPAGYLWIRVTQIGGAIQLRGGPVKLSFGGGLAIAASLRLVGTDEISETSLGIGGSATAILPLFNVRNLDLGLSARVTGTSAGGTSTLSAVVGVGMVI